MGVQTSEFSKISESIYMGVYIYGDPKSRIFKNLEICTKKSFNYNGFQKIRAFGASSIYIWGSIYRGSQIQNFQNFQNLDIWGSIYMGVPNPEFSKFSKSIYIWGSIIYMGVHHCIRNAREVQLQYC